MNIKRIGLFVTITFTLLYFEGRLFSAGAGDFDKLKSHSNKSNIAKEDAEAYFKKYYGGAVDIINKDKMSIMYEIKTGKKYMHDERIFLFIGERGEIIRELRFKENEFLSKDRSRQRKIRGGGGKNGIYLYFSEYYIDPKQVWSEDPYEKYTRGEIVSYDARGNEIFRKLIKDEIWDLTVSRDGSYIYYYCESNDSNPNPYGILIDRKGKELFSWGKEKNSLENSSIKNSSFSPSEKYFAFWLEKPIARTVISFYLIRLFDMKIRIIHGPFPVSIYETKTEKVRKSIIGITDDGGIKILKQTRKKKQKMSAPHVTEEIWREK